jgi:hypothetical protein
MLRSRFITFAAEELRPITTEKVRRKTGQVQGDAV